MLRVHSVWDRLLGQFSVDVRGKETWVETLPHFLIVCFLSESQTIPIVLALIIRNPVRQIFLNALEQSVNIKPGINTRVHPRCRLLFQRYGLAMFEIVILPDNILHRNVELFFLSLGLSISSFSSLRVSISSAAIVKTSFTSNTVCKPCHFGIGSVGGLPGCTAALFC